MMVTNAEIKSPREENGPVWSESDLQENPHVDADKAKKVEAMFTSISSRYDLNNRLHSLWLDQVWRKKAVKAANVTSNDTVLDVACGTGDLSTAFARANPQSVLGIDFTQGMIDLAVQKAKRDRLDIEYRRGDAMQLDVPDESVDVLSIAFGIRNVQDPRGALQEFQRVLRPSGRLVILEFSTPKNAVIRFFNSFYTRQIMPRTASFIAGDDSGAYQYLPKSVDTFLEPEGLLSLVKEAGFSRTSQTPFTFGVCTLTVGYKVN
ncbi:MAG: bifunctional demethylmenaquinone methyltransferase/2-methoxy-6-polyprenyl-1,4-benzoquinol methylase UbiE [Phycisphaerales bacterium]|nr:bifunctional demethylmenaquinone methyltransferase/2-methoxy-6-polyprenyl-1,4-benzoquinol methylase UbiE [Phycisphaerales bacterium]